VDAGVEVGHEQLHRVAELVPERIERADVIAVPVRQRDRSISPPAPRAAPISVPAPPPTVVSTSVEPSSSRTGNALKHRHG
jgi:hypothetical protein